MSRIKKEEVSSEKEVEKKLQQTFDSKRTEASEKDANKAKSSEKLKIDGYTEIRKPVRKRKNQGQVKVDLMTGFVAEKIEKDYEKRIHTIGKEFNEILEEKNGEISSLKRRITKISELSKKNKFNERFSSILVNTIAIILGTGIIVFIALIVIRILVSLKEIMF